MPTFLVVTRSTVVAETKDEAKQAIDVHMRKLAVAITSKVVLVKSRPQNQQ